MQIIVFLGVLLGIYSSVQAACKPNQALLRDKFGPPSSYNRKTYYTSKTVYSDDTSAIGDCKSICGYLVEVSDADEMNFLLTLLSKDDVHGYLISGSDEKTEGKWVHQRTGKNMSYLPWHTGEPNNSGDNEDCLKIFKNEDGIFDVDCKQNYWQLKFVCEV